MATAAKQVDIDSRAGAPAPSAVPEPKKRSLILPIVLVLALIGGAWGVKQWLYGRSHVSTDNAAVDGHLVPVLAKVGGYVTAVQAAENSHVTFDSTLVTIDPAELRVKVSQAEADLAAARAASGTGGRGGQAQAAVQSATGQRGALEAQSSAARANLDKANADLARFKELAAKQIVSRLQLDAAQAAADAAAANYRATLKQETAATGTIAGAEAGVALAEARLRSAQASRENAALQLSYTHVTSPVTGTVSRKQVEVGQLVQPGQPLLTVVSDTGTWVTANFKETQLSTLKVGQKVTLEVDAYGGCEAEGKVGSLGAATGSKFALLPPDNATGNFTKVVQRVPVRIEIVKGCGTDRPLRPGMSVVAHVITQ
ncbi:MAG: multidrug resistance protein [Gemmatimonadetes bacterium]|nr:multidrug resistance protein [Gemmatimonadota bacterium]